jgi:ubiquitin carboxyl-terminal hydrolase 4/11/15
LFSLPDDSATLLHHHQHQSHPFPRPSSCTAQLTFTTSSTKKRKLSPQSIPDLPLHNSHDIPLDSVEGRDSPSPTDLPRFDLPANDDLDARSDSALPPHIPSHLAATSAHGPSDGYSSAASSPSAAYAGLSIESERGADSSYLEHRRASLAPADQDARGQSPRLPFAHRGIMGGAQDLPLRSSSPLKRRASNLDAEEDSSQKDDVDMITVPDADPADEPTRPIPHRRTPSVDMLKGEEQASSAETGMSCISQNAELLRLTPCRDPSHRCTDQDRHHALQSDGAAPAYRRR